MPQGVQFRLPRISTQKNSTRAPEDNSRDYRHCRLRSQTKNLNATVGSCVRSRPIVCVSMRRHVSPVAEAGHSLSLIFHGTSKLVATLLEPASQCRTSIQVRVVVGPVLPHILQSASIEKQKYTYFQFWLLELSSEPSLEICHLGKVLILSLKGRKQELLLISETSYTKSLERFRPHGTCAHLRCSS